MIFLGLASNYRGARKWQHLFARGRQDSCSKLKIALGKRYQSDQVYLYHTGRSALAAAYQALLPQGGTVVSQGLTCIAVPRAVQAAGCQIKYVDIDPATLQFDFVKLETVLQRLAASKKHDKKPVQIDKTSASTHEKTAPIDKNAKVCYNGIITVQNTLGITLDAKKLEKLAQKYHFAIVEDLAHSAGRFYADGREVGTIGQATVLSFGKSKAIDTISGGALIWRVKEELTQLPSERVRRREHIGESARNDGPDEAGERGSCVSSLPKYSDQLRDRWYPIFAAIARGLHHVGLQKIWLGCLLKAHWIRRSADAELNLGTTLPAWQAELALKQLENLPKTPPKSAKNSGDFTQRPLRDYRLVKNRPELLLKLQQKGYYLDEIWYDTPVSPIRYQKEANFPAKDCPETVRVAKQIINIPTWYSETELAPIYQIIEEENA